MSGKQSAGVLLYRRATGGIEVFLAHPGGPFWSNRDAGAWTIPKGEIGDDATPEATARRKINAAQVAFIDRLLETLA